jgi:beta-xylosidase
MKVFLFFLSLILVGFIFFNIGINTKHSDNITKNNQSRVFNSTSISFKKIVKQKQILNNYVESSPFIWEGKLYYLIIERDMIGKKETYLAIYNLKNKKRVARFGQGLSLASAIVHNKILYIYGTKKWQKRGESEIFVITTNDLKNFTMPNLVYKAVENQSIFNTSVTYDSDKDRFIMAFETDESNFVAFSIRFLESTDLVNWSLISDIVFGKDIYAACPTIRYINGYYYMWFLMEEFSDPNCKKCVTYVERISRSKDLLDWETSPHYFLVPDRPDEGINTSDLDIIEFQRKSYIFYSVGDQATWSHTKYAVYDGNLSELVNEFF